MVAAITDETVEKHYKYNFNSYNYLVLLHAKFVTMPELDFFDSLAINLNFNQIYDGQSDKFRFNPLGKSYLFQKDPFQEPI